MDYRLHRPIATVNNWVSSLNMVIPETIPDLVENDMDDLILVLHDAEPGVYWESLMNAINELCGHASAEITFSLHEASSGVPHMRPTSACVQATDASLLPLGSDVTSNHM